MQVCPSPRTSRHEFLRLLWPRPEANGGDLLLQDPAKKAGSTSSRGKTSFWFCPSHFFVGSSSTRPGYPRWSGKETPGEPCARLSQRLVTQERWASRSWTSDATRGSGSLTGFLFFFGVCVCVLFCLGVCFCLSVCLSGCLFVCFLPCLVGLAGSRETQGRTTIPPILFDIFFGPLCKSHTSTSSFRGSTSFSRSWFLEVLNPVAALFSACFAPPRRFGVA